MLAFMPKCFRSPGLQKHFNSLSVSLLIIVFANSVGQPLVRGRVDGHHDCPSPGEIVKDDSIFGEIQGVR